MKIDKCSDIQKLAILYKEFLYETYKDRCIASIEDCIRVVTSWVDARVDIYALSNAIDLFGFSLSYVETNDGTLKPAYRAEITYVVPKYRKTKWSYKLLKLPIELANSVGLPVVSKSTIYNKVNNIHSKLGGKLIFEERILEC